MSRTALVINPWVTDFKLYDEWMHPVGLYFLISLLRHNGWQVRFFDCLAHGRHARGKAYGTGDFQSTEIPKPDLYRSTVGLEMVHQAPDVEGQAGEDGPEPDEVPTGRHAQRPPIAGAKPGDGPRYGNEDQPYQDGPHEGNGPSRERSFLVSLALRFHCPVLHCSQRWG